MCKWVASYNAYGGVQSYASMSWDTISVYLHSSVSLHSLRLTQLAVNNKREKE